ncbi:hypothetical protein McanMca71_007498 [Microsporum canis]
MNRYRNIPGRGPPSKATPTTLQERPYGARPSRTQQLSNPRLRPQLSTEVPNDLLRTKGVADEQLSRAKEERSRLSPSRSPERDYEGATRSSRKRARSVSSCSSVSTISTSRSRSPPGRSRRDTQPSRSNARPRSPARMARPEANQADLGSDGHANEMPHRIHDQSSHRYRRSRYSDSREPDRRRERSREDTSHRSRRPERRRERSTSEDEDQHSLPRSRGRAPRQPSFEGHPVRQNSPPRQRSLSPYSKRLALTQAMNAHR